MFKIFQLIGDLTDLAAFWLMSIYKGTKKHEKLIDRLEQIEADCYFIECFIHFLIYSY